MTSRSVGIMSHWIYVLGTVIRYSQNAHGILKGNGKVALRGTKKRQDEEIIEQSNIGVEVGVPQGSMLGPFDFGPLAVKYDLPQKTHKVETRV